MAQMPRSEVTPDWGSSAAADHCSSEWEDLEDCRAELEAAELPSCRSVRGPPPSAFRGEAVRMEATVTHAVVSYWGCFSHGRCCRGKTAPVFYAINCVFGDRSWQTARRYSDFVGLHEGLRRMVAAQSAAAKRGRTSAELPELPRLPPSSLVRRTNASQEAISRRRDGLAAYLAKLVRAGEAHMAVRIQLAAFLTGRIELPMPPPAQEGRPGIAPEVLRSVWHMPDATPWPGIAVSLPWAVGGGVDSRAVVLTFAAEGSDAARRRAQEFAAFARWCTSFQSGVPTALEAADFLVKYAIRRPPRGAAAEPWGSPRGGVVVRQVAKAGPDLGGPAALMHLRRDHFSIRPSNFTTLPSPEPLPLRFSTPCFGGVELTIAVSPAEPCSPRNRVGAGMPTMRTEPATTAAHLAESPGAESSPCSSPASASSFTSSTPCGSPASSALCAPRTPLPPTGVQWPFPAQESTRLCPRLV